MGLLDAAADLFAGGECPGCSSVGFGVCALCASQVRLGDVGPRYRALLTHPLWAASDYVNPVRRLISQAKDHHRWDAIPLLSQRLALAVAGLADKEGLEGRGAIVPVPSTNRAVRERGLDTVATMASRAVSLLVGAGMEVRTVSGLRLVRRTRDQGELSSDQRMENLADSMEAIHIRGWIVVVDDVVTTGASFAEAARALTNAGCDVRGMATVAATVLRR